MNLLNTRSAARQSLHNAFYNPRLIVLLHSAAGLAVSLLLTVMDLYLSRSIDATVGLGGMGTRAVLQSVQSFLVLVFNILLPFWQIGIFYAAIGIARGRYTPPSDLLEGFRQFGRVLRTYLLQLLLVILLSVSCMYIASMLFMSTPYAEDLMETLEPMAGDPDSYASIFSDPTAMESLMVQLKPVYLIFGLLILGVGVPALYLTRMANYCIMDDAPGAFAAIVRSLRMMLKNWLSLLKVDLRFWWYFALKILAAAVAYADLLLPLVGIHLPVDDTVLYFASFGVYVLLDLLIAWFFGAYVQTTYAHCYDRMKATILRPVEDRSF